MSAALTYFGLGLGVGALFLGLLWLSVRLLVSGQGGLRLHALLAAARFLALGGAFFLLARLGPMAALLALAGLVAARLVILRLVRPEAA